MPIINTPYGDFEIVRKKTVAISVVRMRRSVRHHYIKYQKGDVTHIEHRTMPKYLHKIWNSWSSHIATYDMDGNWISLEM